MIASASHDKTIKIWNIEKGECINTLDAQTNDIKYMQIIRNSPDVE